MELVITREQYLDALEIIDKYHRQLGSIDVNYSKRVKIRDWDKLPHCPVRLQNILLEYYDWKLNLKIEYMDQISKRNFLIQRNAGIGSWSDFCKISGIKFS